MLTIGTLLVTAVGVLFCTCSQSPGVHELASAVLPMSPGYERMFGISERWASVFALPATFATAYGFIFFFGKQMASMSRSRLYPSILSWTVGKNSVPYVAYLTGSVIGYVVLLCLYLLKPEYLNVIFNVCILSSFFTYICGLSSFVLFRWTFKTLKRKFLSPLGIVGAVYGIFVFGVALCGVSFFQPDDYLSIEIFAGLIFCFSLYYALFVRKSQYFSEEEQKIMLKIYVVKGNSYKLCFFSYMIKLFLVNAAKKFKNRTSKRRVGTSQAASSATMYSRIL